MKQFHIGFNPIHIGFNPMNGEMGVIKNFGNKY